MLLHEFLLDSEDRKSISYSKIDDRLKILWLYCGYTRVWGGWIFNKI